uniref:Glycosyltransferase n=1 Tax=Desulfobacca acetoxidans TaxID=60893 RepID=A0A7V4G7S1_9BACT
MARILYGVHGSLHGHAVRALTLARRFREHTFLFVSHGRGAALLRPEFQVVEIPGPLTVYRDHRVDQVATLRENLRFFLTAERRIRQVMALIRAFQPDAALCDYDFLVPRACRRLGLPCLAVDHQHIITACRHTLPPRLWGGYLSLAAVIRLFFSQASHHLVISFFRPPLRPGT